MRLRIFLLILIALLVLSACAPDIAQLEQSGDLPGLLDALRHDDASLRQAAVEALGRVGDSTALEALLAALGEADPALSQAAAQSVRQVLDRLADPAAIPALDPALEHPDPAIRRAALDALGRLGGVDALTPLAAALDDSQLEVRQAAATRLAQVVQGFEQAGDLPALQAALAHANPQVRGQAATAFSRLGGDAALESLLPALQDDDPYVRQAVVSALGELGEPALEALGELFIEDPGLRTFAGEALGKLGLLAVPRLEEALQSSDPALRLAAIDALGQAGDETTLPLLLPLLSEPDPELHLAVTQALLSLGVSRAGVLAYELAGFDEICLSPGAEAAPAKTLAAVLGYAGYTVRQGKTDCQAVLYLESEFTPLSAKYKVVGGICVSAGKPCQATCYTGASVATTLRLEINGVQRMLSPQSKTRKPVEGTITSCPKADASPINSLWPHTLAANVIDLFGPLPLIEAIRNDEMYLASRNNAADLAMRDWVNRHHAYAVPELIRALEDDDHAVRIAAAAALGGIGEQAIEAVPELIELLADNSIRWKEKVSETAAASLRKITGEKFKDQAAWREWWDNRP